MGSIGDFVVGMHGMSLLGNKAPGVVEDLLIAQHPVAVKEQHDWGIFEHLDAVDGEFVVKGWWESDDVGNCNSFADPLVEQVKGCEREK